MPWLFALGILALCVFSIGFRKFAVWTSAIALMLAVLFIAYIQYDSSQKYAAWEHRQGISRN